MESEKRNESRKLILNEDDEVTSCSECPDALKVNCRFLPYKAQFFFFYGGISCVLPFFSVFLKQLGMNPTEIGVIYGIKPFLGCLSSPTWGVIADKFKLRKFVLLLSITAWVVTFLIIAHLPLAARSGTCPPELPLQINMSETEERKLVDKYTTVIDWIYADSGLVRLFYTLIALTVIGEMFWSPIGALSDTALLSVMDNSELFKYPYQRSWGALGMAVFQIATGAILRTTIIHEQICGIDIYFTNYRVAFYIFASSMLIMFFISSSFEFKYDSNSSSYTDGIQAMVTSQPEHVAIESKPSMNIQADTSDHSLSIRHGDGDKKKTIYRKFNFKKLAKLLCSVHYFSWLICIFYMGFCNGIILGFLFWYLEELGGSSWLMGVAGGTASGSEFAFYYMATWFVKKVGTIRALYVALITYAIRFTNYAFMVHPWLVMPSEVLQGFTFATAWAAIVQHAWDAVPGASLASILGMLHGMYWGFGIGAGHLLGGILIDHMGAKKTFTVLIAVTVIVACAFGLAQATSKRPVYGEGEDDETD